MPTTSAPIHANAFTVEIRTCVFPFSEARSAELLLGRILESGNGHVAAGGGGASLNRLQLRYLQAYGAFLVKARLWQADLRNSYLSEADLREANLRQADLQFAVLDRAKLSRASLQETDLRNSNLNRIGNLIGQAIDRDRG